MGPQEKLQKMLEDGKITEQEYEDLISTIQNTQKSNNNKLRKIFFMIPWQIWLIVISIGLAIPEEFARIPSNKIYLLIAPLRCLIIFGLIKRIKWIYCLFIFACLANIVFFWPKAFSIAVINLPLIGLAL